MTVTPKSIARALGIDTRKAYQSLSARSITRALAEQGLDGLANELRAIVPDLRDQYTGALDAAEYDRYWEIKMRGLHAFQVKCTLDAIDHIGGGGLVVADIGDSSGNHGAYIKALAGRDRIKRIISVNLDPVAVEKIKAKGGEAICCRAEELEIEGLAPNLVISFETVEHLTDPVRFLHSMATTGNIEYLLITVPYRRRSRFGGAQLRLDGTAGGEKMTAEEVHIFEFSPTDWELLARFAGYRPVFRRTYLQYPRKSALRLTAPLWRSLDFEGFLAFFLTRDLTLSDRYTGW